MKQSEMKRRREERDLGRAKLFFYSLFSFFFSFLLIGGAIVPLFPRWSRRAKRMIQTPKSSRVVICHLNDKKTFGNYQDMFLKKTRWFDYVFFSMLYLGYCKHALAHRFYPRAVILHKCVVLDYICQTSQQYKATNKNTYQIMS